MSDSKSPKDKGGPLVKTGPTRGEVRSRNQDGQWRAKRNDAGKPRDLKKSKSDKKGCFLTTAACEHRGLPDNCHELQVMRMFRDDVLAKTAGGNAMIKHYYEIAPHLVPLLGDHAVAEEVWTNIETTVAHIEAGQPTDAISAYQEMVDRLAQSQRQATSSQRQLRRVCKDGQVSIAFT